MFELDSKINFDKKENDILSIGEVLVDMISEGYGDNLEGNVFHKHFGGSAANIAMNTKKLGIKSVLASAVGRDGFGKFLIDKLAYEGVDISYIQEVDRATSMVVVTKSVASPVPVFYRDADFRLEYSPQFEDILNKSKIIHFTCWPISMKDSRITVEKAVEAARENGILIGFDPNYHPMVWNRNENGLVYIKSIIGKVDVVKPSEDDAERLFGKDTPEKQINKFLELGAKLVILTLGKNGAMVSNGIETACFKTMAHEIVDTTGAGDAFWSGFYSGLVNGYTIREAVTAGMAVSAYKLKFIGAIAELPILEEIRRLYGLV